MLVDGFVLDERIHHVLQHRQAVRSGAIEFAEAVTVTHGALFLRYVIRTCANKDASLDPLPDLQLASTEFAQVVD
jgi:hypothetical protein